MTRKRMKNRGYLMLLILIVVALFVNQVINVRASEHSSADSEFADVEATLSPSSESEDLVVDSRDVTDPELSVQAEEGEDSELDPLEVESEEGVAESENALLEVSALEIDEEDATSEELFVESEVPEHDSEAKDETADLEIESGEPEEKASEIQASEDEEEAAVDPATNDPEGGLTDDDMVPSSFSMMSTENVEIKVDLNGGSWVDETAKATYEVMTVPAGTKLYEAISEVQGYVVNGDLVIGYWLDADGNRLNYDYSFTSNAVIKPFWSPLVTVKIDPNGGTWKTSDDEERFASFMTIPSNTLDVVLTAASRLIFADHKISHWIDEDGNKLELSETTVEKDRTVRPVWVPAFTLTIDADGGTFADFVLSYGLHIKMVEENDPILYHVGNDYFKTPPAGMAVFGWQDEDGNMITYEHKMERSMTVRPIWKKGYKISLDLNGGQWSYPEAEARGSVQDAAEGAHVFDYLVYGIERDGYGFDSWQYEDGTEIKHSDLVDRDMTIKPDWKRTFTVKVDANGGTWSSNERKEVLESREVIEGRTMNHLLSLKLALVKGTEAVSGFVDENGAAVTEKTKVNHDMTIKVLYSPGHLLKFDLDGGTDPAFFINFDGTRLPKGTNLYRSIGITSNDILVKPGYMLDGWVDQDGKAVDKSYEIQKDIVLKPVWVPAVDVLVDLNGGYWEEELLTGNRTILAATGRVIDASKLRYGRTFNRNGHVFEGFEALLPGKTEYVPFDLDTPVTSAMSLRAKWRAVDVQPAFSVDIEVDDGQFARVEVSAGAFDARPAVFVVLVEKVDDNGKTSLMYDVVFVIGGRVVEPRQNVTVTLPALGLTPTAFFTSDVDGEVMTPHAYNLNAAKNVVFTYSKADLYVITGVLDSKTDSEPSKPAPEESKPPATDSKPATKPSTPVVGSTPMVPKTGEMSARDSVGGLMLLLAAALILINRRRFAKR